MSRAYRQLVADTQHMLVGNYVVKVFQNKTAMHAVARCAESEGMV
jgi:hypothetical protein